MCGLNDWGWINHSDKIEITSSYPVNSPGVIICHVGPASCVHGPWTIGQTAPKVAVFRHHVTTPIILENGSDLEIRIISIRSNICEGFAVFWHLVTIEVPSFLVASWSNLFTNCINQAYYEIRTALQELALASSVIHMPLIILAAFNVAGIFLGASWKARNLLLLAVWPT